MHSMMALPCNINTVQKYIVQYCSSSSSTVVVVVDIVVVVVLLFPTNDTAMKRYNIMQNIYGILAYMLFTDTPYDEFRAWNGMFIY